MKNRWLGLKPSITVPPPSPREMRYACSDRHAGQVGDVLAQCQAAVERLARHVVTGILSDQSVGEFLKGGSVGVSPPVPEVAVTVVLAALIVEAVADLVPDDCSDAAVIDGIVGFRIEERRLQNRAGNTISFMPGCSTR